jgi:flagellar hook protein FlgE
MTAFGATGISISRAAADGYAAGSFANAGIDANGRIYAAYTNGQRATQYLVAIANFADAGGLLAANGEAFRASAMPIVAAAAGGAIAPGALEGSNVDLGTEITRSLVAQRAYSASARLVATSDEMLKELMRVKR